ncbi:hypothetical protein LEP48_01290 [Isoptericola sp. NEAU-Y5]|uniref:Uncharacterized protein n=1 Tax=Isoptericola luteus TaxID=2879484 RepID=A0ABS7ZEE7_9MICO|nr:hypothetical protein [Isoptericola sp. NEAU-Y5]MCA5891984.1 hypothetical protein [Isoptericola sp. NEAU-Y5]
MDPSDVQIEPHDPAAWREMPDRDACILVGKRPEGVTYWLTVNPDIPDERVDTVRSWAAGLLSRIGEHGFERAMEMDGWQHRSDGDWQLWGRSVLLPDPGV